MTNGSRPIGEVTVPVRYCGHNAWSGYESKKTGKPVAAGGAVTVREDWSNGGGHSLTEYRFDTDHVDPVSLGKLLDKLECGAEITLTMVTYQSQRNTTWQNVVGFDVGWADSSPALAAVNS